MIRTRLLACLCALVALALPVSAVQAVPRSAGTATSADPGPGAAGEGGLVARDLQARAMGEGTFVGLDGLLYEDSPQVVEGQDAQLFWGPEFDIACALGRRSLVALKSTTMLARLIEKSGRRVIWTAAPNKANVFPRALNSVLPHGSCDQDGLAQQRQVIDHLDDPNFLPLRRRLAHDPREVYFKTDLHWTTVGGAAFAEAVAATLDPRLGRRQNYTYGTETRVGLLNYFRGDDTLETAQTAHPAGKTEVHTDQSSVEDWAGYPATVLDHSWNSGPAKRTWPGRTLLLGDSFMLYALEAMRPVFRHGRFMFLNHVDEGDVIRAIKDSDTVVMETLQTFAWALSPLIDPVFRAQLRRALR